MIIGYSTEGQIVGVGNEQASYLIDSKTTVRSSGRAQMINGPMIGNGTFWDD